MSNKVLNDELDPHDGVQGNKANNLKDVEMKLELNQEAQIFEQKRKTFIQNNNQNNIELEEEREEELAEENQQIVLGRNWSEWIQNEDYCLAITGRAFRFLVDERNTKNQKAAKRFRVMLQRTQVFARMKPEDKSQLIQELQQSEEQLQCGMCGDGANDCGALKTADIGISLSEAEASIAAPFTSKVQDIRCVVTILKEGRCALVTSFQCFKYMALYSMIQFSSTTILYFSLSQPADFQFFYWDLCLIIPLAFLMGLTKPYKTLSRHIPGSKLISFSVLFSVIGQTAIQSLVQIGVFLYLIRQKWFMPCKEVHDKDHLDDRNDRGSEMQHCYEPMTLFWVTNYQYIATVISFSIGKPWRQPFYKNLAFTAAFLILTGITIFIQLFSNDFVSEVFLYLKEVYNTKSQKLDSSMPSYWPFLLLIVGILNSVVTYLFEKHPVNILGRLWQRRLERRRKRKMSEFNQKQFGQNKQPQQQQTQQSAKQTNNMSYNNKNDSQQVNSQQQQFQSVIEMTFLS